MLNAKRDMQINVELLLNYVLNLTFFGTLVRFLERVYAHCHVMMRFSKNEVPISKTCCSNWKMSPRGSKGLITTIF